MYSAWFYPDGLLIVINGERVSVSKLFAFYSDSYDCDDSYRECKCSCGYSDCETEVVLY